jgi:hypothetical protein
MKTNTKQWHVRLADIITKRRAGGIKPRTVRYKFRSVFPILPIDLNQKRPTINVVCD